MDYIYQYNIAKKTQERLSEIAYTAFVTAISTIISTAITLGAGAVSKKLLKASGPLGTYTKFAAAFTKDTASELFFKKILEVGVRKSASIMAAKLVLAVFSEIMEELYVDPWIEAYVSKKVRDMGGNAWEQTFWASFAESGRESFGSSVVSVMKSAASFSTDIQQQQALSSTDQNSIRETAGQQAAARQDAQQQETLKDQRKDLRNTALSTAMMFAGALAGGIFGSAGIGGFSNILIAGSVGFDLYLTGREFVEEGLKYKKSKALVAIDLHSKIADPVRYEASMNLIEALELRKNFPAVTSEGQGPKAKPYMVEIVAQLYPNGFYGTIDPRLGAFNFFVHLGYDIENILVYTGGMGYNPNLNNKGNEILERRTLTSTQVRSYSEFYQRKLARLSIKYALDLKKIIIDEYGRKMLEKPRIPLSSIFDFRFDKSIRKVTYEKRDKAVGPDILNRIKLHITHKYNSFRRVSTTREISYKRISDYIGNYLAFSEYVSSKTGKGRFSISNIKYQKDSLELAPKSWLFENIRYALPKKFGFHNRVEILTWVSFRVNQEH